MGQKIIEQFINCSEIMIKENKERNDRLPSYDRKYEVQLLDHSVETIKNLVSDIEMLNKKGIHVYITPKQKNEIKKIIDTIIQDPLRSRKLEEDDKKKEDKEFEMLKERILLETEKPELNKSINKIKL